MTAWSQEPSIIETYESKDNPHYLQLRYYDHDELDLETDEESQEFISWDFVDKKDGGIWDSDHIPIEEKQEFLKKGNWVLKEKIQNKLSEVRKVRLEGKLPDRTLVYHNSDRTEYLVIENYTQIPSYINYYFCTDDDIKISLSHVYSDNLLKVHDMLKSGKWYFLKNIKNSQFRKVVKP